jgi:hypothetical protein
MTYQLPTPPSSPPESKRRGVWTFVDASGNDTGRYFDGPEHMLEANTPAGHTVREGHVKRPFEPTAQDLINQLEAGQARAMRELALNPGDKAARDKLAAIDAAIDGHRRRAP